jgi:hypothetical protein
MGSRRKRKATLSSCSSEEDSDDDEGDTYEGSEEGWSSDEDDGEEMEESEDGGDEDLPKRGHVRRQRVGERTRLRQVCFMTIRLRSGYSI